MIGTENTEFLSNFAKSQDVSKHTTWLFDADFYADLLFASPPKSNKTCVCRNVLQTHKIY